MKRTIPILCVALLLAAGVSAQTVVNPSKVVFTASPDHSAVVSGVAVLTNYQLDVMKDTATGALAFTQGLGKPTPSATNDITVTVAQFLTMGNGTYVAKVSAVGPGGANASAPSNPFVKTGAPAAPTAVRAVE